MSDAGRLERLVAQFSGSGENAAIWDAFALLLPTDSFLNMGYSPWYLPHAVGSSQRRLGQFLGRRVALELGYSAGATLLDVGCGRGGPTIDLARQFGFDVTGIDLVAHNVSLARANAREAGVDADFCVGDARDLPVESDTADACVVVDAAQYVTEMDALLTELHRVTRPGGVVVVSDLVRQESADVETVARFAEAWDMATPRPLTALRADARTAGLTDIEVTDITANSVGRFDFWTGLYLRAERTPLSGLARPLFTRAGVDLDAVTRQIEATHPALPQLGHVVLVGRVPEM